MTKQRPIAKTAAALVVAAALCVVAGVFACSQGAQEPSASGGAASAQAASGSDEAHAADDEGPGSGAASSAASDPAGSSYSADAAGVVSGDSPGAADQAPYVQDEVLVQVSADAAPQDVNDHLKTLDFIATDQVTADDIAHGFLTLQLAPGVSVEDALALLSGDPVFGDAQPNFIYEIQDVAESAVEAQVARSLAMGSPLYAQAASINDPYRDKQWGLQAIHAYDAWETLLGQRKISNTPSESTVGVAVIDEGFNVAHEDLKNVIVGTYNAVTKGTDVSEVRGKDSHGTHVAGIVGAQVNNGLGVAGVSYNAKLLLVKVFDESTDESGRVKAINTAYIAGGFDYVMQNAKKHNIRVVNASVGSSIQPSAQTPTDKLVFSKIDQAYADYGIVTVCSGGNEGSTAYNYPSDYPTAVSVIGVANTSAYTKSSFSSYNADGSYAKTIAAPGGTDGTIDDEKDIYSTFSGTNSAYGYKGGTSMAAPHVAGVLALVCAANPKLTADQAVSVLYSSVTDINTSNNRKATPAVSGKASPATFDNASGFGLVNAKAAVEYAEYAAGGTVTGWFLGGRDALLKDEAVQFKVAGARASDAVAYSSTNTSVASVSSDGVVTAKGEGYAVITATATAASAGGKRAARLVRVYDPKVKVANSSTSASSLNITLTSSVEGMWKWSSANPKAVTVPGTGTYASGEAVVATRRTGDSAVLTATLVADADVSVAVAVPASGTLLKDISSATVRVANATYTGQKLEPNVTVVYGGTTLSKGTDYTVEYKNNTAAGTATVVVTGAGTYTGTKQATFTINKAPVTSAMVTIAAAEYTGKPLTPSVTVKVGGRTLVYGTDYTRAYSNNVGPGQGIVTITGIGNYTGVKTAKFNINQVTVASGGSSKSSSTSSTSSTSSSSSSSGGTGGAGGAGGTGGGSSTATSAASAGSSSVKNPAGTTSASTAKTSTSSAKTTSGGSAASNGKASTTASSASTKKAAPTVRYRTYVSASGWQAYVANGKTSNKVGARTKVEGFKVQLQNAPYSGSVKYSARGQMYGWKKWVANNKKMGSAGLGKRLEAVRIKLTGAMAKHYNVYYRVKVQKLGWLGWAKNGAKAGTQGYGYRTTAMQVKLVAKTAKQPTSAKAAFRKKK